MMLRIRRYAVVDLEWVIELSIRAWAPVFASLETVIGSTLFERLRGDWRQGQAEEVRRVVTDEATMVWVADVGSHVAGFVAARPDAASAVGEIVMLAVDPDRQRAGIGSELTRTATEWLRDNAMRVAMVETGGDPGHAPARHTYERAGFKPLAITRFFKLLDE